MSKELIMKKGLWYSIIDGTFRVQVPQDHLDAVRRDWKSVDGKNSGTKYERIVNALFGVIQEVSFQEGEYGTQILIKLDENEDGENPIVALGTGSREGEDLMKKLPNIDLSKEIRLRPFNFTGQDNDEVRGMEVMQQDDAGNFTVKIVNFFVEQTKQEDGSFKRMMKNGFPAPEGDTDMYSKDDWKIYFLSARKFLIAYTKENILPKLETRTMGVSPRPIQSLEEQMERQGSYPKEEINPNEIPF